MKYKPSGTAIFLFGTAIGAWLNIWPGAIWPAWGAFVFAYLLVIVAMGFITWDKDHAHD